MKGLCGWFSQRPLGDAEGAMRAMQAAGRMPASGSQVSTTPQAAMAVHDGAAAPLWLQADGFALAALGHPRLDVNGTRSADPHALLQALRTQGREALPRIGGDFALATWDARTQRGLLAIDRLGVHQLVYGRAGDALVFGSTLDLIGGFPGLQRKLSHQGLFDYLFYHVSPGPGTICEGLLRLEAGHCIEFDGAGPSAPRAYWSMQFREQPAPFSELKQEFTALLGSAVREATEGAPTGAFLSGGTDSSTISGMLARHGSGPAHTFSIGFDAEGFDEMAYARIAAQHFGCQHHEYYVTPEDVVDAVPRIATLYDQPFGNASAIPTYYCARLAREHGITRLLGGDGGDELFGGNERYAKHYLLGMYSHVPAPLKRLLIEPLLLSVPGVQSVPLLSKVRSYVLQARPPMPARYNSYNLLEHLGQHNVFTPEFLASVNPDHGQKLLADAFEPYADASLINQMLGIDLRFILADGDLPKVTRMCELAGVDIAFPLLDDRVVAFSQRLESSLKLKGTQLRWFFKEALKDFLPPAVITKEKHGFGLPVGAWLVGHPPLLKLAADAIAPLRERGIVRPQFVDELFSTRLQEHAKYFGTMIWVLMMLGLWLDSRKL